MRNAGSSTVLRHIWNLGYGADEYLNNHASTAYSVISNSKITVIAGHGAPGYTVMGSNTNHSYFCADANIRTIGTRDANLSNLSGGSLSGVKMMMYVGCNTGKTPDPIPDSSQATGYIYPGNLVSKAVSKGAKCSVGFTNVLYDLPACEWVRLFFEYIDQERGPIWEAYNHADYWVSEMYPDNAYYRVMMTFRFERGNVNQYLSQ